MTCEARDVTAVIANEIKQPHPYFEPTDWEVGGKNPFRDTIEERKEVMKKCPTLFSAWGNA